jgi:hypothetical protein
MFHFDETLTNDIPMITSALFPEYDHTQLVDEPTPATHA